MIYIILFLISFTLTYFIKNYAIKKSLVAQVNERSSHTVPTPHGGGVAIAVTWFLGLLYLYVSDQINQTLFYSLMIGIIISIISYLDDLYELNPKIRLIVQTLVALCGLISLGGLDTLELGFFSIENQIVTNIFALLLIIWFINLYNFLDGIDGYAGSEAVFLSVAGFLLFGGEHFLVLAVGVLGFLVWNWHKAKIFMGDVGSTLLGYNIAIFTIYYSNEQPSNIWIWSIIFALFYFDATLTLYRRYKNGEKLSQAHKKHAYQRLSQSGWSHSKVTTYSIVVNIFLFILVYSYLNIYVSFVITMFLLYAITRYIDKEKKFKQE